MRFDTTKTPVYCCCIGSWSASTSPARSPSPSRYGGHYSRSRRTELPFPTYGTTSLCQRSRSPSPARLQEMRERDRLGYGIDMGTKNKTKKIMCFIPKFCKNFKTTNSKEN